MKVQNRADAKTRRGGIILAVLGLVFLMAVIMTQFLDSMVMQIRAEAVRSAKDDFRVTAYSLLEISLAVINEFSEIDEGLSSPSQGWGNPLEYAQIEDFDLPDGWQYEVKITDETGKIPLINPDEKELKLLFEEMGISFSEADILVDSLVDWMDEDDLVRINGAEEDWYQRQDPPITPANAPIDNFETLRHIRGYKELFFDEETGLPNGLFTQLKQSMSLHNTHAVNINTAPPLVRQALGQSVGFDDYTLDSHMLGPDREAGTNDDEFFRTSEDLESVGVDPNSVGHKANVLKVEVIVSSGEKRFLLSAMVNTGETGVQDNRQQQDQTDNQADPNQRDQDNQTSQNNQNNQNNQGSRQQQSGPEYPFELLSLVENMSID